MAHSTIAVISDCDDTLAPDTTAQLLKAFGVDPTSFYKERVGPRVDSGWDPALAYMHEMIRLADEGPLKDLTQARMREVATQLEFFPGVPEVFPDIRQEIETKFREVGVRVEFFVISGGIAELIAASRLGGVVKKVWGCDFAYGEDGRIAFPKRIVSFTEKTRFVFSIQKGQITPDYDSQPYAVNEPMSEDERQIPFRNMVYLGDGPSDIPCMSLLRSSENESKNGFVIGILSKDNPNKSWALGYGRRANITVPPDFREEQHGRIQLQEAVIQIASRIQAEAAHRRSPAPKY